MNGKPISVVLTTLFVVALSSGCQFSDKSKPMANGGVPATPKKHVSNSKAGVPAKSTTTAASSSPAPKTESIPETPLRAEVPRSFTWTYTFQPEPGIRKWSRIGNTKFVERYPSGKENTFTILEQTTVDSVQGTLVQIVGGKLQGFIPDKGSANMYLKMRGSAEQNWGHMGEMKDVE
jgi:hypothetical protein